MEQDKRIVKVAINTNIIDKHLGGDPAFYAKGWENADLSVSDFAKCINEGWAYCAQLKGNRKSDNFSCSNIASVDIDSGSTIDEVLAQQFTKSHLTMLYVTPSHTVEFPRFRLVFLLPRVIEDRHEQEALNRALSLQFKGDPSTVDAARIFFGSHNSEPLIFDGVITEEILELLLENGKAAQSDTLAKYNPSSRRSAIKMDPTTIVRTANGEHISLGSIAKKTPVNCLFHADKKASAFVSVNQTGHTFLHCVVCRTTHWVKSDSADSSDKESLPDFVKTLQDRESFIALNKQHWELMKPEFRTDNSFYTDPRVTFTKEKFFNLPTIHNGLTLIKSPKGSGKTTSLPEVMKPLLFNPKLRTVEDSENVDIDEPPHSIDSNYKVLLIGHRQALIRDLCKRLGLNCYLDDAKEWWMVDSKTNGDRKSRYGVCLDSLRKVQGHVYDLIIIDESEQVISHFLSETFQHSRDTFKFFVELISSTPSVVALDADLGWLTYLTLCEMKMLQSIRDNPYRQLWMYINEYSTDRGRCEIYDSKHELISLLIADIKNKKRVYVSSNSKSLIDQLFNTIGQEIGEDCKRIKVTSDNSNTTEMQDFILNIKQRALDYQVILSSPSLGTGIDITFDKNLMAFDAVYGFYEALVNTHTDIDQQLSRVRHPGATKIWISKREFDFSTNFDVVKSDLLINHVVANTCVGYEPITHKEIFDENDPFVRMASLIVSQQRNSKNRLLKNFIQYKESQGWNCVSHAKNSDVADDGSALLKSGKQLTAKQYRDALYQSEPISKQQFQEIEELIESNQAVSHKQGMSFRRAKFELFYRQELSDSLIALDDKGKLRGAIIRFELVTNKDEMLRINSLANIKPGKSKSEKRLIKVKRNHEIGCLLINQLLKSTPIFDGDNIDSTKIYTAADLKEFSTLALKLHKYIEGQFSISVRRDISQNPTQTLGQILALIGLQQEKVSTKKQGDMKIYRYRVIPKRLSTILDIVKHRKETSGKVWDFVNKLHGFDRAAERSLSDGSLDETGRSISEGIRQRSKLLDEGTRAFISYRDISELLLKSKKLKKMNKDIESNFKFE